LSANFAICYAVYQAKDKTVAFPRSPNNSKRSVVTALKAGSAQKRDVPLGISRKGICQFSILLLFWQSYVISVILGWFMGIIFNGKNYLWLSKEASPESATWVA